MTITVAASGTQGANDASVTVNKPVAAKPGDVLLVSITTQGNKTMPSVPAGMTVPSGLSSPEQSGTASANTKMWVHFHKVTEGSPASWTWTQSASAHILATWALIRQADATTPIQVADGDGGDMTAPSVTTTSDALLVFLAAQWTAGVAATLVAPGTMTQHQSGGTGSAYGLLASELVGAGPTGTRTGTTTVGNLPVAALVAFTPGEDPGNVDVWDGDAWQASPTMKKVWTGSAWS